MRVNSQMSKPIVILSGAAMVVLVLGTLLIGIIQNPIEEPSRTGTAGMIRAVQPVDCGMDYSAQREGGCDPSAVDEALPVPQKVQAHVDRANRLILLLRWSQARAALDQAVSLDPSNIAALKLRARLALSSSDEKTAWEDLNTALKFAPQDSDLLATRAEIRWSRDEKGLALQDVNAAIKANPFSADALWIRGRMLMLSNRLNPAIADFSKALKLRPNFREALLLRAQTNLRMQDFEGALRDADALLGQNPASPSILEVRAFAHIALGHLAEAAQDLTAVLGQPGDNKTSPAANPHHRRLLIQRMVLSIKLDRKQDAQQDVDMLFNSGGKPGVLQLQLFLRQNGYPEVQVDGLRSLRLEEALRSCLVQRECQQALEHRI